MLNFILKYGNVTVYQWKYGEPCPDPEPEQTGTENVNEHDGIDWGLGGATVSLEDDGIDFGGIDFEEVTLGITVEDSGVTAEDCEVTAKERGGGVEKKTGESLEGEDGVGKEPLSKLSSGKFGRLNIGLH